MRLPAAFFALWLGLPALLAAEATLVVVTGLGGEPRYEERFHAWAATLVDAAADRGLPEANVVYLAADPDRDPRARARSTRDNVGAAFRELAAASADPLFVVVIGHGSFRDGVSKVNLPGPDLTAEDLAGMLAPFGDRPTAVAVLTSSSGGFLEALSAPGRVVMTATRSGMERNVSVFAQHFVAAFVGGEADVDHDGRLSALEAFTYARREVERAYDREQKLLTEHAVLDDDGDGEGSARPGPQAGDGRLAATMTLAGRPAPGDTLPSPIATDDSELAGLVAEKAGLEQSIAELRGTKESLSREEYEDRLEDLLIRLALANRAIRERDDPSSGSGS